MNPKIKSVIKNIILIFTIYSNKTKFPKKLFVIVKNITSLTPIPAGTPTKNSPRLDDRK